MGNTLFRALESKDRGRLGLAAVAAAAVVVAAVTAGALFALAPAVRPEAAGPTTSSASGPDPTATPVAGTEVQPPDPGTAPRDRIPPRTPQTPRVTAPLPPSASAAGSVVEGFPLDLAALSDGSDVIDTSVSSEGDRMQFTLVVRTDASGDAVRAHYAAHWTAMGLTPDESGFRDPFTSVSLTVRDDAGTGTIYTVYGVARTA